MKDIQDIKIHLISKSVDLTKKIRDWEDLCRKVGVDPGEDRAYTAITAYRDAVNEILQEIKASNDQPTNPVQQRY